MVLSFIIIRTPWSLVHMGIISYDPLLFYSYCIEIIISPFINFSTFLPFPFNKIKDCFYHKKSQKAQRQQQQQ
jgi:hypothetical protein